MDNRNERETGIKLHGVSSGIRKTDKKSWGRMENIQECIRWKMLGADKCDTESTKWEA